MFPFNNFTVYCKKTMNPRKIIEFSNEDVTNNTIYSM